MILKCYSIFLCALIIVVIDGAKTTQKGIDNRYSAQDSVNIRRSVRQLYPYSYDQYNAQGYNAQHQDAYGQVVDDGYYNSPSSKPRVVTGRIPAGRPVNIGNGHGNTNVVALTSGEPSNTDIYLGQKNSGDRRNNGYDYYDNTQGANSGILISDRGDGTDDVVLWNKNSRNKPGKNNVVVVNRNRNGDADYVALQGGGRYDESYIALSNNRNKPNRHETARKNSGSGYYGDYDSRY